MKLASRCRYCAALVVSLACGSLAAPAAAQSAWKPSQNVELMVPSAAGGGFDRTGRAIQKLWQTRKLLDVTTSIVNKPGGGGAVGWAYLNQHPGNGHYVGLCSPTLLTNRITGGNTQSYTDFTPIAHLVNEYIGFAVRADSPIKTAKDLVALLAAKPDSTSIAIGTAPGGPNHIGVALVARGAGLDIKKLKIVVFRNGAESATALLGGHVDVMASSPGNLDNMLEAKQIRVIAIAAPRRMTGVLAGVPVWKEYGVDGVFANWRCVIGPRGLTAPQVAYWEEVFSRIVATDEWKTEIEENVWEANFLRSAASRKFFETEDEVARRTLVELGMAK